MFTQSKLLYPTMKMIRYNGPDNVYADWDSFFSDPFRAFAPLFRSTLSSAYERSHHTVEWYQDDDNYYARVELPGVKREHLSVDAEDGLVSFSYERHDHRSPDGGNSDERERFEQVLRSPEGVNLSAIEARLSDGILELTLPKAAEKKPVRIEIK